MGDIMDKEDMEEAIYFDGVYLYETEKALLIKVEDQDIWFAKSKTDYIETTDYQRGDEITFAVPRWIAEEKELM